MKSIICVFLIMGVFGIFANAQNAGPRVAVLPAGIANWSGEDSDKLLKDPVIKTSLKKMLGTRSYAAFIESFETLTPILKEGDVLFASGCLIHACTHLESAIAVNLKNNTIHAAIYDEEKPTRYFNERGRRTPKPIVDWAKNLDEINSKKP